MKLNYKRTVLVGLAFLSISAFWQMYDNVVPLILRDTFHLGDDVAGVIMAVDNMLALFMLPLFGMLSDRTSTRIGKRMPYILGGTAAAVLLMNMLPIADNRANLPLFMLALGLLLIAMCAYRSPAVALMPDVTPKPLRSKGNAIINLMGALGGVFTLGVTGFLVSGGGEGRQDYTLLFLAVGLLMAVAVAVLALTVKEKKLADEVADLEAAEPEPEPCSRDAVASGPKGWASLPKDKRKSLLLILCSVFLWFMGYNAVTTAFTKYVGVSWGDGVRDASEYLGMASQYLMIATVGAVISFLPVGFLATRFGRKRVIQGGVLLLAACFGAAAFYQNLHPSVYGLFALVGVSWAMINVNSYPMVAEISKSGDVGKFTGYYYAFSMAAQIVTPIVSGILLQHVGYWTLFPYAALMVAGSFVTISLTRHGDSKPMPMESKLEAFGAGEE
ncbi:MAG: MFS transporter [Clostridia bacterium]|nr:MFS transporter [Clostridia bacterium]